MLTIWFIASMTKSMRIWTWIGRNPARAMPTATPVMASSESGVPKTRSGPYLSVRPRVVPRMAFGSSTSRPKSSTFSSRAISWSVASRMASTKVRCLSPVLAVYMLVKLVGSGKRTLFREFESVLDLGLDVGVDALALLVGQHAPQPLHLIGLLPGIDLLAAAEAEAEVFAWTDVLHPAAGFALDEARAGALAQGRHGRARRLEDAEHIPILDRFRRNAVRPHPAADVGGRLALGLVRVDGIAVVLAYKQQRKALQRREVQAFGENALFGSAVAVEADHHALLAAVFRGVGVPDSVQDRCRDHRRGSHHAARDVHEMHRAALAAGAAVDLAVELGNHGAQAAAFGEVHRVPPIRAEHDIRRRKRLAHPHGHRLLAYGEMHRALDLVARVAAHDRFLYPADAIQRSVKTCQDHRVDARRTLRRTRLNRHAVRFTKSATYKRKPLIKFRFLFYQLCHDHQPHPVPNFVLRRRQRLSAVVSRAPRPPAGAAHRQQLLHHLPPPAPSFPPPSPARLPPPRTSQTSFRRPAPGRVRC